MYKFILLFLVFSFLGWVIESTYCSILDGKLINRGFLKGPVTPIYGTGAIFIVYGLIFLDKIDLNIENQPILVFVVALILCSILEYFASYIMEKLFNLRWWDYSDRFLNIKGRICAFNAICFGILGTLTQYYIYPAYLKFYDYVSKFEVFKPIIITLCGIFIIDFVVTYNNLHNISKRINEIKNLIGETFVYRELLDIKEKIGLDIKDFVGVLKDKIQDENKFLELQKKIAEVTIQRDYIRLNRSYRGAIGRNIKRGIEKLKNIVVNRK